MSHSLSPSRARQVLAMRPRPGPLAAVALLLAGGCGLFRSSRPEALPDGSYRVRCEKALVTCLAVVDSVCGAGYEVVHAAETHERRGSPPIVAEDFTSEAVFRCRAPKSLFGSSGPADAGSRAVPPAPVP